MSPWPWARAPGLRRPQVTSYAYRGIAQAWPGWPFYFVARQQPGGLMLGEASWLGLVGAVGVHPFPYLAWIGPAAELWLRQARPECGLVLGFALAMTINGKS